MGKLKRTDMRVLLVLQNFGGELPTLPLHLCLQMSIFVQSFFMNLQFISLTSCFFYMRKSGVSIVSGNFCRYYLGKNRRVHCLEILFFLFCSNIEALCILFQYVLQYFFVSFFITFYNSIY